MKRCPMCGANAPDGATICYECLYSFQDMSCVAVPPRQESEDDQPDGEVVPDAVVEQADPIRHPGQYEVVVTDPDLGQRAISLESGSIHIGRLPTNDVVLNDRYVSRRHLHIYFEANSIWAEDFGAANPARINGERLSGKVPFSPGDVIEVRDARVQLVDLAPGVAGSE